MKVQLENLYLDSVSMSSRKCKSQEDKPRKKSGNHFMFLCQVEKALVVAYDRSNTA